MSAIADEIVRSLDTEPERWAYSVITLTRDDGLALDVIKPFDGSKNYARLSDDARGNPLFGWSDTRRIQKAVRRWQLRARAAITQGEPS